MDIKITQYLISKIILIKLLIINTILIINKIHLFLKKEDLQSKVQVILLMAIMKTHEV